MAQRTGEEQDDCPAHPLALRVMHKRRWPTDTEESVDKVMVRRGGWTGEENRSSRACGREVGGFDYLGPADLECRDLVDDACLSDR